MAKKSGHFVDDPKTEDTQKSSGQQSNQQPGTKPGEGSKGPGSKRREITLEELEKLPRGGTGDNWWN